MLSKTVRVITILGFLSLAGLFVLSLFISDESKEKFNTIVDQGKEEITQTSKSLVEGTQELQPFAELTIPYLREQTFNSQLAELEQISSNSNYTSYLTSYQSDNLKINGLLTQPTGTMPEGGWPAVVFIHGYIPPDQYQTTERYVSYVDYLARNGFVVFKIDLRGHGDSEGQAGGAYYSSNYITDTLNAYSALENADFVHAEKIGLWGHSMAGNVVLRSMAVKPTIPAAVIWGGAVYTYQDMQEYGISDSSYQRPSNDTPRRQERQRLFETYGEASMQSDFWREVAPTNYLADLEGAIQLHHAQNDSVVSIEYSEGLNTLLDQTDIPHEFYSYPSGGHDIEGASFSTAMRRTVEFYQEYLK